MTSSTHAVTAGNAVDRFLDAVTAGAGVPSDLLAPDVVLDATVPDWRFTVHGRDGVARQYGEWFRDPASFEEIERLAVDGGELVTYLLRWAEDGVPHAAHHCHLLRLDDEGRVASDRFFCGGRWNADLLAEMAAAAGA